MHLHIYGDRYILRTQSIRADFSESQFKIIKAFFVSKNIDDTVHLLLGNQNVDEFTYKKIYSKINNFILDLSSKFGEDIFSPKSKLSISGEEGKFYPRVLNIELTNYCNFKCGHCYKEADNLKRLFLDFSIIEEICDKFKDKVQLIHLTGGEPLSHPEINKIIKTLHKNNFLINITTNGSLYSRLSTSSLESINNFQISLYGCDHRTYQTTAKNDSFDTVINFINYLESINKNYDIGLTINRLYIENHDKYNSLLNKLNYKNIVFSFAEVTGRCLYSDNNIWPLSDDEKTLATNYIQQILNINHPSDNTENYSCDAGTLSYSINEYGEVRLCQVLMSKFFAIGGLDKIIQRSIKNNFSICKQLQKYSHSLTPMC